MPDAWALNIMDAETILEDARAVRVERVRYVPVHVRRPDFAVLPMGEALEEGKGDRAALRASYGRTVGVVGRAEGISPLPAELP